MAGFGVPLPGSCVRCAVRGVRYTWEDLSFERRWPWQKSRSLHNRGPIRSSLKKAKPISIAAADGRKSSRFAMARTRVPTLNRFDLRPNAAEPSICAAASPLTMSPSATGRTTFCRTTLFCSLGNRPMAGRYMPSCLSSVIVTAFRRCRPEPASKPPPNRLKWITSYSSSLMD